MVVHPGEVGPTHAVSRWLSVAGDRRRTAAATGSRPARATGRNRSRVAAPPP